MQCKFRPEQNVFYEVMFEYYRTAEPDDGMFDFILRYAATNEDNYAQCDKILCNQKWEKWILEKQALLNLSIWHLNPEEAKRLIRMGVCSKHMTDLRKMQCMQEAFDNKMKDVTRVMIQFSNIDKRTVLKFAAENGYVLMLEFLIYEYEFDVDTPLRDGSTLLDIAVKKGLVYLFNMLIGKTKDPTRYSSGAGRMTRSSFKILECAIQRHSNKAISEMAANTRSSMLENDRPQKHATAVPETVIRRLAIQRLSNKAISEMAANTRSSMLENDRPQNHATAVPETVTPRRSTRLRYPVYF
jgi:hypothetical protein